MSCSLIALFCFDPAGVYISASMSAADSGVEIYTRDRTHVTRENTWGGIDYVGSTEERSRSHRALNPYGRLAIGYERPIWIPELRLSTEIYHESSVASGSDRGVNGVRIDLHLYPWGGAR